MTELLLNSLPEGKISFPRKHVSVFISCEILKLDLVDAFGQFFFLCFVFLILKDYLN